MSLHHHTAELLRTSSVGWLSSCSVRRCNIMCLASGLICSCCHADNERYFITHVLAFFAGSDGIVMENLAARFMSGLSRSSCNFWLFFAAVDGHCDCQYSCSGS